VSAQQSVQGKPMSIFSRKTEKDAVCASKASVSAAKSAAHDLRRAHHDARANVRSFYDDAANDLDYAENQTRRFIGNVYEKVSDQADHLSGSVRDYPLSSVAILLTAGILIGSLLKRRW